MVKADDGSLDLDRTMEQVPALAAAGLTDVRCTASPTARGRVGRARRAVAGSSPRSAPPPDAPTPEHPVPRGGHAMTAAPTDAPPLGFWKIAETLPGPPRARRSRRARDHGRRAAGRRATSSSTACAPWASSPATRSRCCCPTRRGVRALPRRRSGRASTSCRSTGTSSAPRSRTSCSDCEAKVFVAHARFAEHAKAAADEIDVPRRGPLRRRRRASTASARTPS